MLRFVDQQSPHPIDEVLSGTPHGVKARVVRLADGLAANAQIIVPCSYGLPSTVSDADVTLVEGHNVINRLFADSRDAESWIVRFVNGLADSIAKKIGEPDGRR